MKIILIIFLLQISAISLFCDDFPQDSILDLNTLQFNDSILVPDFSITYSKGWFPRILDNISYFSINTLFIFGDTWDMANNIRSNSFINTRNPFTDKIDLEKEERQVSKKNSNDFESAYPQTYLYNLDVSYHFNPFSFLITKFGIGYEYKIGLISSIDNSKNYLDYFGNLRNFQEVNFIELSENSFSVSPSLQIPFYGAFASQNNIFATKTEFISSFYYLIGGVTAEYVFHSSANQYSQITNAKDELRYKNGLDTLHLQTDVALKNLNRFRLYLNSGLGVDINLNGLGIGLEFIWRYPLTNVLSDANWRQNFLYLNLSFYGLF